MSHTSETLVPELVPEEISLMPSYFKEILDNFTKQNI